MKISLILLAAGNSKRFGSNKLLALFQGKPMITHLFDTVNKLAADQIIVITQANEVEKIAQRYGFEVYINEQPEKGISSSIKLGVSHVIGDAAVFIVCDQPMLSATTIQKLITHADHQHILRVSYDTKKGNPALFPKSLYDELMQLEGDEGGKVIMRAHPELVIDIQAEHQNELIDFDTKESLNKYR